jgi:NAD(P)-dependent dehydrogenase (short-subunit alcohol dehydrogenase family)
MISLEGKNILVTGASSGIGKAVAITCAQLGAKVLVSGRDAVRLNETLLSMHGTGHAMCCADLCKEQEIEALAEACNELQGVVHAAGIIYPLPAKFIRNKHLREVMQVNYEGPVILMSALLARKKVSAGASLVFISSVSAHHSYAAGALYTASKSALEAYAQTLAIEYAAKKIRVNVLSPGLVRTPILEQTMQASGPEQVAAHERKYPLGFGEPKDVAEAAAYFLSDSARWITGQNLILDGGLTLGVDNG